MAAMGLNARGGGYAPVKKISPSVDMGKGYTPTSKPQSTVKPPQGGSGASPKPPADKK
jgi:hypothetical protein